MKVEMTPAEFHDLMNAIAMGFLDYEARKKLVSEAVERALQIPPVPKI
jgi:hypothetical protein